MYIKKNINYQFFINIYIKNINNCSVIYTINFIYKKKYLYYIIFI